MGKMPESGLVIISVYNTARPHQALCYRTPVDVFTSIPFEEPEKGVIESLTTSTIDTAGLYLSVIKCKQTRIITFAVLDSFLSRKTRSLCFLGK